MSWVVSIRINSELEHDVLFKFAQPTLQKMKNGELPQAATPVVKSMSTVPLETKKRSS